MRNKALLWTSASALASCVMLASSPAFAAPPGSSTTVLVDGNSGSGTLVLQGQTVVAGSANQQTTYSNFETQGGAGSGGGAGLGGVFFVDNGATLTLNNASFVGNSATGGNGGGIKTASAAATALSLVAAKADASTTPALMPSLSATWSNGQLQITGMTLESPNSLIGVGAGVAVAGAPIGATISAVTTNGNGSQTVSFAQGYTPPSSALASGTVSGLQGFPVNTVTVSGTYGGGDIRTGMTVYGEGVPDGTTITAVNYDGSGHVTSYTLSNPIILTGNNYISGNSGPVQQSVAVIIASQFDVTRYQAATTTTLSNVITPTAAIAGFSVGMTVSGAGVPAGTTVTAIDSATGAITLSNQIDLSQVKSITAAFSPLLSNSGNAVIKLDNVAGLAVGQTVSGQGIASGTTITAINGNTVTLSGTIGQAGVTAIDNGTMIVSANPVLSIDTANRTIAFASVAGLSVGALLTGSDIPANAVITGIDANTRTVSYAIDPSTANLVKGGAMNSLVAGGTVGLNGSNGQAASNFNATLVNGEGQNGTNGGAGGAGNAAAGGNGGNGGTGSDGNQTNFSLISEAVAGPLRVVQAAGQVGAAFAGLQFPLGTFFLGKLSSEITQMTSDIANLAVWVADMNAGLVAFGGTGGVGGRGGAGATFFGGGAGGNGGTGGRGAQSDTDGGAGGAGGAGGEGGFGAGGGSGGAGGAGGATGNSVYGANGAGGLAGFGGGVGSSNGIGGGGGSGYGGAVFVRSGGTLSLTGNSLFSGNNVYGGSSNNGGSAGNAAGSGLFIMDGANVWMAPGTGNTITFLDTIADDSLLNVPDSSIAVGQGADVHITGGGTVQFFGDNTYTGKTYIHGATLEALDGVGINSNSHVTLAGSGTIGNLSTSNAGVWLTEGTISRRVGSQPTQLSWDGSGGFAATQAGLTLNFGGNMARQALTWGSGGFVSTGSTLVFGSDAEDATGVVTLLNTINLNGQTGRIAIYNNDAQTDYAVLAGTVTGGDLTVNDTGYDGALYLTAQNSISGIVVNNGLVSTKLGSQIGRLMDAASGGSVLVNGGVLELGGAEKLTTVNVLQQGAMIAHGQIQAGAVNNAGYISFGSTTSTGAIVNSAGALLVNRAQLSASTVSNGGNWAQGGDLTLTGQFTNNGTLALMNALVNNTPTATTRTIHTSGFAGSASGVVDLDNNTLVIDQWGNSTYAGTFTGAGSLTKQGAGSLNLTGASTFTGGLTVAAGTIDTTGGGTLADNLAVQVDPNAHYIVGTSDTIGSINNAGYVTTNANLVLNTLTNSGLFNAYAGLTSTGLVDNTAAGTINLHAGSTPTFASLTNAGTILADAPLTIIGAYRQNAGTLTANANLSSGSLSGTGGMITLGGPNVHYTINQTANGTYSGAVSGGVVDKMGTANLTLNGAVHSFAPGSLNVQQGTVTAAAANVLNDMLLVNVAGPGALALNANQTIQTLTGSGLLSLGANNLTLATGGNFTGQITGTGQVLLASGQFTLTSSGTSQSNLFTVNPQSTLNVAQSSTVNATTVNVNSAAINLDGRINATTVNFGSGSTVQLGNGLGVNQSGAVTGSIASTNTYVNGGTVLKGNGSVSGLTTVGGASAGTIAPGNSPGVMTFANLTFGNNAIAAIQIDGEAGAGAVGGNDLINVTGTLTLSGSSVLALQKSLPASAYQMPLGKAIRIFNYAPGHVSGHFGSVTKTDHTPNLIFNLSDGTVVSLGTYTPASVVAATTNPNLSAILNAMPVTTAGGVPQYYGGTLLAPLLAALGSGGTSAMNAVFQQWAPDGYGDILNQMQSATLNNLPELGSYKRLRSGRIIVTGEINNSHIERAPTETASTSAFHDTAFNTGFSGDLSFARVNVSYGHSTGGFKNANVESDMNGDTVSLGVSVPVTGDQALRLTGRFLYGKYNATGTRQTLNGSARFGSVKGDVTVYGGGLEYYRESGEFEFVGTAEYLRIKQETGAFSEASSINPANPLDLFAIDAMTQEMATAKIAARIGYRLSPAVTLYSRVSYDHDFMNDPAVIVAQNIIDPLNLTLATPGFVEDRVEGRLGLRYAVTPSLQLNLDGGIGNGNGYRFSGGARLTF